MSTSTTNSDAGTTRVSSRKIIGIWIVLLAILVPIACWRVIETFRHHGHATIGDGLTVESYGFDLTDSKVSADRLDPEVKKDAVEAMVTPETMLGKDVKAHNEAIHGKFLVSKDRVVGISLNGESRAYPIRILNWHEIVNDVVGGVPIAVTYSPMCDSVVVFDRRVGGQTREFGLSGLLLNANHILYDRQDDPKQESLWSQLKFQAIAGPAGRDDLKLKVLPSRVAQWSEWLESNPQTSVIMGQLLYTKRYKRDPYGPYFSFGRLQSPVDPMPPSDDPRGLMTRIVAIYDGTNWVVSPLSADDGNAVKGVTGVNGVVWNGDNPPTFRLESMDRPTVTSCWFAWYAMHGS